MPDGRAHPRGKTQFHTAMGALAYGFCHNTGETLYRPWHVTPCLCAGQVVARRPTRNLSIARLPVHKADCLLPLVLRPRANDRLLRTNSYPSPGLRPGDVGVSLRILDTPTLALAQGCGGSAGLSHGLCQHRDPLPCTSATNASRAMNKIGPPSVVIRAADCIRYCQQRKASAAHAGPLEMRVRSSVAKPSSLADSSNRRTRGEFILSWQTTQLPLLALSSFSPFGMCKFFLTLRRHRRVAATATARSTSLSSNTVNGMESNFECNEILPTRRRSVEPGAHHPYALSQRG
jgi:hypothetical protein